MAQHHHQQPALYDFVAALEKLQQRIQELSATKQASAVPSTRLGVTWSFMKANRGNALLLMTFYSMSTASVIARIMSEHRLQSDRLLEGKEQEHLQRHIHRLEHQVQQQQLLLDGIAADLQQHGSSSSSSSSSSSGGWWGAAAVQQRLVRRIQGWRAGEQAAGSGTPPSSSSSSSAGQQQQQQQQAEEEPRQQESFGVKVGHLGRGFLI